MHGRSRLLIGGLGAALAAGVASACSPQQAAAPEAAAPAGLAADIRVTEVVLGSSVGLDKRVAEAKQVFAPEDTIHVSVVTDGRSSDTLLAARWLHEGRVLEETAQPIAPDGTATSEFHIAKPGGFDKGAYEVEILVEGRPLVKRGFTVQ